MINHDKPSNLAVSLSLWKQAKMAKFGQAWILLWAQHFTKTSSQNWVDSGGDLFQHPEIQWLRMMFPWKLPVLWPIPARSRAFKATWRMTKYRSSQLVLRYWRKGSELNSWEWFPFLSHRLARLSEAEMAQKEMQTGAEILSPGSALENQKCTGGQWWIDPVHSSHSPFPSVENLDTIPFKLRTVPRLSSWCLCRKICSGRAKPESSRHREPNPSNLRSLNLLFESYPATDFRDPDCDSSAANTENRATDIVEPFLWTFHLRHHGINNGPQLVSPCFLALLVDKPGCGYSWHMYTYLYLFNS